MVTQDPNAFINRVKANIIAVLPFVISRPGLMSFILWAKMVICHKTVALSQIVNLSAIKNSVQRTLVNFEESLSANR